MITWNDVLSFANNGNPDPDRTISRTNDEWRALLSPAEFGITRLKGTERPFGSELCDLYEPGRYRCVCCSALLFDSTEKFDGGTGWPSFSQPIAESAVAYYNDNDLAMIRIEVTCNACEAHLGYVFHDGPEPSGLRYCINAGSLRRIDESSHSPATTELAAFRGGSAQS